MKIQVKQLGTKSREVKTSNRNMEKMYTLQLEMAQADDVEDKEPVELIKMQYNVIHSVIDFLTTVLTLTKAEQDKLGDMDFKETVQLANYVMERMMGMSDEDIDLAQKKQDADKSTEN